MEKRVGICLSLLVFSMILWSTQWETHLYWPAIGVWPLWRNLTVYYLLTFLILFINTLTQVPGQLNSWKVCVEKQMQYKLPCVPVHSCLQICTNTADLAEKEHHHHTSLVNFVWKGGDALQTTREAFSNTSWGFSYTSAINGTQAAKSTCITLKMYPWGPNSQQQKQHKPFYSQDFCFLDAWREKNRLCSSLNLFPVHRWTDASV